MSLDEERFHVRPGRRDDARSLAAVYETSATEEEVAGFAANASESPFSSPDRLAAAWREPNRVGNEEILVAEVGGRVVAYATLEDRGEALEIVDLEVAKDHQRRGVGTRLVESIEDRARAEGRTAVTLGTSRNAAGVAWTSLPWWQARGYHVTHEEENAWTRAIGPGAREIRMRKDMQPPERVELRPVRPRDLEVFFEQTRDPLAVRMAAFTPEDPSDRAAFDKHWARVLADPKVTIRTVWLGDRVVGHAGSFVNAELGKPEVTYWVGREYWGRGLATLALAALLREVRPRPIYARVAADNVGSRRVLEKCGFVQVGRSHGFANARGAETEELLLVLGERRGSRREGGPRASAAGAVAGPRTRRRGPRSPRPRRSRRSRRPPRDSPRRRKSRRPR